MLAFGTVSAQDSSSLKFGPTRKSEFKISGQTNAFVIGVSGLNICDFQENGNHFDFQHPRIIDAEKSDENKNDDLWCEQLTNANQLAFGGWARLAGFKNEDDIADMLRKNPSILDKTDVYSFVFSRIPKNKYKLDDYQKMFRMVANDGKSLRARNAMGQVDDFLRAGNGSIYLQLDFGQYGQRKTGSHAITMYGFTYSQKYKRHDPRYYTGVIVSDSDNHKRHAAGTGREAPNSMTIIPIAWDPVNCIYTFDKPSRGYIRFLYGLKGVPMKK